MMIKIRKKGNFNQGNLWLKFMTYKNLRNKFCNPMKVFYFKKDKSKKKRKEKLKFHGLLE